MFHIRQSSFGASVIAWFIWHNRSFCSTDCSWAMAANSCNHSSRITAASEYCLTSRSIKIFIKINLMRNVDYILVCYLCNFSYQTIFNVKHTHHQSFRVRHRRIQKLCVWWNSGCVADRRWSNIIWRDTLWRRGPFAPEYRGEGITDCVSGISSFLT